MRNCYANRIYRSFYEQSDPNGIRTRVTAVKGRCPRPLDDRVSEEPRNMGSVRLTFKLKSARAGMRSVRWRAGAGQWLRARGRRRVRANLDRAAGAQSAFAGPRRRR